MNHATRRQQGGFTLIEIAIVLVIIGLLLGGILKGQELITSARVRNIADQASGVQAAYYGFVDRYRQVPGDWGVAGGNDANEAIPGVATGGDGNGLIDGAQPWTEALAAWEQLQSAGFIGGEYIGGAVAPPVNSTDQAPRNAYNGFLALAHTDDYQDGGAATVRLNLAIGAQIPVNVMRELDVKVDDGQPLTGTFRAALANGATLTPVTEGAADCVSAAAPFVWNVTGNQQNCNGVVLYQ